MDESLWHGSDAEPRRSGRDCEAQASNGGVTRVGARTRDGATPDSRPICSPHARAETNLGIPTLRCVGIFGRIEGICIWSYGCASAFATTTYTLQDTVNATVKEKTAFEHSRARVVVRYLVAGTRRRTYCSCRPAHGPAENGER